MIESTGYYTIKNEGKSEIREMASKFYAVAFNCQDKLFFNQKLQAVRLEYPRATHYCLAYRLDIDGLDWKADDDGEPSGTAGLPILSQIKSSSLFYAGVIITRYYGGTKLGTSGLINAYRNSAHLAINNSEIIWHEITRKYELVFKMDDYAKVQSLISHAKKWILDFEFKDSNRIAININLSDRNKLQKTVFEILNGYAYQEQELENNIWSLTEVL